MSVFQSIKKNKRSFLHFSSIVFISIVMISFYLTQSKYYENADFMLRDYLFELRGEQKSSGNVVIVDIDEKSLQKYGQWPWQRDLVAKLIHNIIQSGAYVVGLDMVFAEEDSRSPHTIAKELHIDKRKLPNYDEIFAQTLNMYNGLVVGGIFLTNEKITQSFQDSSGTESSIYVEHGGRDHILKFQSTTLNIPILQNKLNSNGFLNTLPDRDGTVRSVPIIMKSISTGIYPSLALEMYKVYLGKSEKDVVVNIEGTKEGIEGIYIDDALYIPTDRFGRILVNYRGRAKTFKYISAKDVLEMNEKSKALNETFVFLGTSAIGLFDMRSTPFDSTMPGVEIHANVLENLLLGNFITTSPDEQVFVVALIVFIVLFSVIIFTISNEYFTLIFLGGFIYVLYMLYYELFFTYHLVLNIIVPFLALIASFIITLMIDFILTSSQKKVVMQAFSKKVSPAVMENLIKHNANGLLEPVEREVSIFFSDIRSFTTISEEIGSPKKLIQLLNAYMTPMVDIIIDKQGTVDKFIGDAIMAYWNAPVELKNHADLAVSSAIKQIEALQKIRVDIDKEFGVNLDIGIGINTGVSTVGDMGSEGRSDYTIIGDHVNLASRLEGLTKNYGAKIIISSYTKNLLVDSYKIRLLDFVKVKGKQEAVEIFEVVVDDNVSIEEIQLYNNAIVLYRKEDIKLALVEFDKLYKNNALKLYEIYIQRCQYYLDDPHKEFDLTLTMTTK